MLSRCVPDKFGFYFQSNFESPQRFPSDETNRSRGQQVGYHPHLSHRGTCPRASFQGGMTFRRRLGLFPPLGTLHSLGACVEVPGGKPPAFASSPSVAHPRPAYIMSTWLLTSTSNLQQSFSLLSISASSSSSSLSARTSSCPSTSAATSSLPASTRLPPRHAPPWPTRRPTT